MNNDLSNFIIEGHCEYYIRGKTLKYFTYGGVINDNKRKN